jgi:hypothetical protein
MGGNMENRVMSKTAQIEGEIENFSTKILKKAPLVTKFRSFL